MKGISAGMACGCFAALASWSRRALPALALSVAALLALSALAFTAAPALAAAPETPTLTVEAPVHATAATFHGVLNPKEALVPNNMGGTYKFLYRASPTECTGTGGVVTKPSGLWHGGVEESVFEPVSGLAPNTEYTVCLQVTNLEGETVESGPVSFKTTVPPEEPETTEPAALITATSAKFEGTLNPHSTAKVGGYFAYSNPGGSSCTEGPTAGLEEFEGEKEEEAIAVHATVGLEPHKKYKVCLVATDELGNATPGEEVVVETLAPAPEVLAGAASYSTATPFEATLHAEVNANDQATTVYFQYSTSPALIGKSLATPTDVPAAPGSSIGAGFGPVPVEDVTGHVLISGETYYYQAVAINPTGTTYGTVGDFETLGVPTVQTGAAEEVTAASASLGGKLDAGGDAEYWVEYGTEPCSVNTNSCGEKSPATLVSGKVQECTRGGVLQECVTPILVTGLEPNTTYHYWLVASNGAASGPVHGEAKEFTTKLAPRTGLAEDVTPTSAQITGELNPGGGGEAEYYVEYLLPSNEVQKSATALASGKTQVSVGPVVLSGLQPNTTYYYWLVAKISAVSEPVRGEARQFTTPISQAEVEAQAAANRKPTEELAAAAAAKQKLEQEEAKRAAEEAAANAAKPNQYDEIAAQTAALARLEAEAAKRSTKAEKAKPKPASCRKGFVKKNHKCVPKKSKKKGKVK
jgi:hypothetical protein